MFGVDSSLNEDEKDNKTNTIHEGTTTSNASGSLSHHIVVGNQWVVHRSLQRFVNISPEE
jgi:hypothetical protein